MAIYNGNCGTNVVWELDDSTGVLTISGSGDMSGSLATGYPWDNYRNNITSIKILEGVTSINEFAFDVCENLTSVIIPDSVTKVEQAAFDCCPKLTDVIIGNGLEYIGEAMFAQCSSLTSITIPNNIKTIGESAFNQCTNLKNITMSQNLEIIGRQAFFKCSSLTEIEIPNTVVSIKEKAFQYCSSLTSVTIPDSVTSVGQYSFCECENLKELKILSPNISFGVAAFNKCYNLRNIMFTNSFKETDIIDLNQMASFSTLSSLREIKLPEGIKNLGGQVFAACPKLEVVTFPRTLSEINISVLNGIYTGAFSSCDNLKKIYYYGKEDEWNAITNITEFMVQHPNVEVEFLEATDSYQKHNMDFTYQLLNNKITILEGNITVNEGIVCIPEIINGYPVIRILDGAFKACEKLNGVIIPKSVAVIGVDAFYDFPKFVTLGYYGSETEWNNKTIDSELNKYSTIKYFYEVKNYSNFVYCIENDIATIIAAKEHFEYPKDLWVNIPDKIEGCSVSFINDYAFYKKLEDSIAGYYLVMPNSIKKIGKYNLGEVETCIECFYAGNDDERLLIEICEGNETLLGSATEYDTFSQYRWVYNSKPYYINNAFFIYQVINNEEISIVNSSNILDGELFLPSFVENLPVTIIENQAFESNNTITSVVIGDNVNFIENQAFQSCENLKTIEINSDIENFVLNNILSYNTFIDTIVIGENVSKITSTMLANHETLVSLSCKNSEIEVEQGAFEGTGILIEDETIKYINNNYTNKKWLVAYPLTKETIISKDVELICEGAFSSLNNSSIEIIIPESVKNLNKNVLSTTITNEKITFVLSDITLYLSSEGIVDMTNNSDTKIILNFNMDNVKILVSADNLCKYANIHGYEILVSYNTVDSKLNIVKLTNKNDILISSIYQGEDKEFTINLDNTDELIIDSEAFVNRIDIKNFKIPNNVVEIGKGAFKGCKFIETFTIPFIGQNAKTTTNNYFTYIFGEEKKTTTTNNTILNLPQTVIIDSEVRSISSDAFNCCGIKNVVLPSKLTTVGERAFYQATITTLNIPNKVTTIGTYGFYSSSLRNINWSTLISTKDITTYNSNCFYIANNPTVNGYKFINLEGTEDVSEDYDEATNTERFSYSSGTITENGESVAYFSLPYYLFCKLKGGVRYSNYVQMNGKCGNELEWYLTKVDDNNYTLNITGNGSMGNYSSILRPSWETGGADAITITEVIISDACTSIGDYAFYNYKNLKSIKLPKNVTTIGKYAFASSGLSGELKLNTSLKTISEFAFNSCLSLTSVTFNNSLTTIGQYTFEKCSGITELKVPSSVSSISMYAFAGMKNLQKIILPFVGTTKGSTTKNKERLFGVIFGLGGESISNYYSATQIYENGNTLSHKEPISTYTYMIPNSLKEIYITGGSIPVGAFSGLKNVEKIVIDDAVTSIDTNIFWGTENLKEIQVPYNGQLPYGYYYEDKSVYYNGTYYTVWWNKNSTISDNYVGSLFAYSINSDYTSGEPYANIGMKVTLTNKTKYLQIPKIQNITVTKVSINYIGTFQNWNYTDWSFNVSLPNNLTNVIPKDCFNKSKIYNLNINVLPTTWQKGCFYRSSIAKINNLSWDKVFADTVEVGGAAFAYTTNVTGNIVFSKIKNIGSATFDDDYLAGAFESSTFTGLEITNSNLIKIPDYTFSNCSKLTSVILRENSVLSIGEGAFYKCNIKNLLLNEGLEVIELDAFYNGIKVEQLTIPNSIIRIGASSYANNFNESGTKMYGAFSGLEVHVKEIITPFVGWRVSSSDNNTNSLLWWFGGKELEAEDSKYINGEPYWISRYIGSGTIPLEKIVITRDYNSHQLADFQFYDWKRKAPNLKIYFTNITSSQASIGDNCFTIYPNGTSVAKYWYFSDEFNLSDVMPTSSSVMRLRSGVAAYSRTIDTYSDTITTETTLLQQQVIKLLSDKDYAWKAILYGKDYDVYITDNNTYADGSSYLPVLYLPNNSRMEKGQQITLIGENTYKISSLESFSYTNKIFYRQSKGVLNGKLSYFNTTTGLVTYNDIDKKWVITDENFKASLTNEPVNFTIGSAYDNNNIDGTIYIDEEGDIIVTKSDTGTALIDTDTITIEKAKITKGTIDADLVGAVKKGTKFYTNINGQIQTVEKDPEDYYNIIITPGFYVSSNGYNSATITLADETLILPNDLLSNTVLLSVETKGIITLEGNTGENIKRGTVSKNLIGIIKKGETTFILNNVEYTITDVNRDTNQVVFGDINGNGFVVQSLGEFKYDITLANYIDLASSDFDKTDLHLTLNYINIYTVSNIERYTELSEELLDEGEILYLVTTEEVITPTNYEVIERPLEKEFTLERYTTIVTVEDLNGAELQHLLVYPDTFYEINSNYIETPQYYFQTAEKQNTIYYVNDVQAYGNIATINSCSAKISAEYEGSLIWYKWIIQENIDGEYYTIKELTEYYNPNIILNYDLFRNDTQYKLTLVTQTKEDLQVKTSLYITVNYAENSLSRIIVDKDCINKAIKIEFSSQSQNKNKFNFDEFVELGNYSGIEYVSAEDDTEKIYRYIGDEEYLYYYSYIPYNNDYTFSYKTTGSNEVVVKFFDGQQNNISSTISNLIPNGIFSSEQEGIIRVANTVTIPYNENTNIRYFQVGFKVEKEAYFSEIQLELGTEATEYEESSSVVIDKVVDRYIILREELNNEESLCKLAEISGDSTYFYDYSFYREETYQYYVIPIYIDTITNEEVRGVPYKLNNQVNYNLKEITLIDTKLEIGTTNNFELINDYEANTDEYSIWHFKYNTDAKNINIVTDKAVYETAMEIPTVNKTDRNYKTGSIKAFLGSFIKEKERLTYRDSIKLQNKFQQFCNNGRVKMLRDEIGNVLPVDVTLTSFEYNPHTIPTNITVTFDWTQVGNEKDLSVWSVK